MQEGKEARRKKEVNGQNQLKKAKFTKTIRMKQLIIFILAAVMFACSSKTEEVFQPVPEDDLSSLNLPEGFGIHTFANVENARSMAVSPSETVFVGNRRKDKVYALQDTDGDWKA